MTERELDDPPEWLPQWDAAKSAGRQALAPLTPTHSGRAAEPALAVEQLRGLINMAAYKRATCIYYGPHPAAMTATGRLVEGWAPRQIQ